MVEEHTEKAGLQADTAHAKGIGPGRLACVLASLPLLYFMSAGPALKLTEKNLPLASGVRTLYRPLFFCSYRCPPLAKSLDWYLVKVWHWWPPFD
jgi:hypothetical protein